MTMRRRIGLSLIVISFLLCLTGCGGWIPQAINIINALLPAVLNLIGFLMAFSPDISSGVIDLITKGKEEVVSDLNLVKTLLDSYDAADANAKSDILSKVHTALGTAKTYLAQILSALHISNESAQHKAAALLDLVIAQVESLMAMIPVIKNTKSMEEAHAYMLEHGIEEPLSAKKFKSEFNRIMKIPTPDAQVNSIAMKHLLS